MYVTRAGSGNPPLFFVHGLACDATDWRAQLDAFSPRTTVAACDLPGHGASPAVPADCTIEAYGRAVADALTELRLPPAILVGHSMGCRVVLAANRARPDAVAGLVLVDGSRIGAGDPEAAGQAMADEVAGDGYPRFMRQFFESMFVPSSDPVLAQAIIDRALRMPAGLGRPLLRDLAGWDAGQVEDALDAVGVPVLAIQSTTMDTARERGLAHNGIELSLDRPRPHPPARGCRRDTARHKPLPADRTGRRRQRGDRRVHDERAAVPARGPDADMRLGLHALGIGSGSQRAVIEAVARAAEQHGFATLWSGEHVVMVDESTSRYPYAEDGKIAVPAVADWIDPMVCLSFAAAATTTIGLATGVLLLPKHNPVIIAKQAASLDKLSGGRFTLGIGIGWSREEFDALGIPFERRAARTADYVAATGPSGVTTSPPTAGSSQLLAIRVNPKPLRDGRIPVVLGGNSEPALRRVAQWGDGWYGFNLHDVDDAAVKLDSLSRLCREAGRDPDELRLAVALRDPQPADAGRLAELGVDELVLVASPPDDPTQAGDWVSGLAADWQ